ncbi:DUF4355 domain-containing protein [Brachybacterium sp. UMB0905]|uniref:DUF4355 domain-containing protein n=1 Tax=Brachybacterium sp. UMB0905 TaxID=2069310 RepID=UPI000C7FCBFA|nr:DUF4355 domain-containing protein [Brachybacterium sp. UMB0905]PMC76401.1 hypothetical protein CJ197_04395 [Brachybacterium sp. UMB0905]
MDTGLLNFLQGTGALMFADTPDDGTGPTSDDTPDTDKTPASDDEPLGEPGLKALRAERQRAAQMKKRAEDAEARLKDIEDAEKTELQRAQERIAELEQTTKAYEAEKTRAQLRASVLASKNVPSEWADFVTGDTEDEMNAVADRIIQNLNRDAQGPYLRPTSGTPGGSLEAGREAAKNFRP